jgi:hypothetical protein
MNVALLVAAALLTALVAAHSYLGERYILVRLFRRDNLPKLFGGDDFTKRTLRLAWHITSVLGLGLAALLVVLATPGEASRAALVRLIAATCALSGLVSFVGSKGRHLSWAVFWAAAAAAWLGAR